MLVDIEKLNIVGAGEIGLSLAIDCCVKGLDVCLVDQSQDVLDGVEKRFRRALRDMRLIRPGKVVETSEEIMNRLSLEICLPGVLSNQGVVENITENYEVKKAFYKKFDAVLKDAAFVAVNTSCIRIRGITNFVPDMRNLLGMHFMNPVYLKNVVEFIRSDTVDESALGSAFRFLNAIEMDIVEVADVPGFVSNQLSHILMNEAVALVSRGVASAGDIDRLFRKGFGHSMGPLETADLIGLDTVKNSLDELYRQTSCEKYICCDYLRRLVEGGRLGKKSGGGLYEYD